MLNIKPQEVVDQKGKRVGVVLSIKDFERLIDALEDYYDYELVQKRKAKNEKTYTFEEVKASLRQRK